MLDVTKQTLMSAKGQVEPVGPGSACNRCPSDSGHSESATYITLPIIKLLDQIVLFHLRACAGFRFLASPW